MTNEISDKDEGLYYRDGTFIGKRTPTGKKILWSRGNGWVFSGIPRTLECLPPDDPRRDFFIAKMRTMAAALAKCQGDDGFWRPNLADPEHIPEPESSGTDFFCHGMAWGIRNGVLGKETLGADLPFGRVLTKALEFGNTAWIFAAMMFGITIPVWSVMASPPRVTDHPMIDSRCHAAFAAQAAE